MIPTYQLEQAYAVYGLDAAVGPKSRRTPMICNEFVKSKNSNKFLDPITFSR